MALISSSALPCAVKYRKCLQTVNEVPQTIATVKRHLKAQGLTYRHVAAALKLSEASVKRVFARESFTVERLAAIAHLLGFTLAELLAESAAELPQLRMLTSEQEAKLVGDGKLLLVAVCALNRWSAAEIIAEYRLTRAECLKYLLVLDRMGLIELLPGDRIRPRVARDFDWLPDGPIRRYFIDHALDDFLGSPFGERDEALEFAQGMVTESDLAQLRQELRRLRARMAALHEESTAAPLEQGAARLMLALRRGNGRVKRLRLTDRRRAQRTRVTLRVACETRPSCRPAYRACRNRSSPETRDVPRAVDLSSRPLSSARTPHDLQRSSAETPVQPQRSSAACP